MISVYTHYNGDKNPYDVRCLSTDSKPADVPNGSTCIEINTGKKYLFDEGQKSWNEVTGNTLVSATGVEF